MALPGLDPESRDFVVCRLDAALSLLSLAKSSLWSRVQTGIVKEQRGADGRPVVLGSRVSLILLQLHLVRWIPPMARRLLRVGRGGA